MQDWVSAKLDLPGIPAGAARQAGAKRARADRPIGFKPWLGDYAKAAKESGGEERAAQITRSALKVEGNNEKLGKHKKLAPRRLKTAEGGGYAPQRQNPALGQRAERKRARGA